MEPIDFGVSSLFDTPYHDTHAASSTYQVTGGKMSNDPKVSREDVFAAADLLVEQGKNVTQRSVRSVLGDIGSYGTIQKELKAWRIARGYPLKAKSKTKNAQDNGSVAYWAGEVKRLSGELANATEMLVAASTTTAA